jgi:hypothetical protein
MHNSSSHKLLKKINRLFDNLSESEGQMNDIEKDLILSYIRELYESIKFDQKEPIAIPSLRTASSTEEDIKVSFPNTQNEIEKADKTQFTETPKSSPEVEKEEPLSQIQPKELESIASIDPEKKAFMHFIHSEVEENGGYQSGRLISDLSKAFGLNDRIYYANELFNGDQLAMVQMIKDLNQCLTFEDVKSHLGDQIEITSKWSEASKREAAIGFINLIKNKYK